MPQTRECDYCETDIEPGTGTMFVAIDGTVTRFCSSKCQKNADLGREPRDLEWTGPESERDAEPAAEEPDAEAVDASTDKADPDTDDEQADDGVKGDADAETGDADDEDAGADDADDTDEEVQA